jgi:putative ABC transport system permease protein
MTTTLTPAPGRLRPGDLARLASVGLRTRKLRAGLSALGIAIGVAAIVAVLGLSQSSSAGLNAEISKLGTNLLTVQVGQSLSGGTAELPVAAPAMIGRLPGVLNVQDIGTVTGVNVYRSPLIPAINTNGLAVAASSTGLPAALSTSVAQGSYLNAATASQPAAVLGAGAAQLLGIDRIWPGERIWLTSSSRTMWFYVTGILEPAVLTPTLDATIFIGYPAADKSSSGPRSTRSTRSTASWPPRPTRKTQARRLPPSRRRHSSHRRKPRALSTPFSSGWGRSRCLSGPSAWPTS